MKTTRLLLALAALTLLGACTHTTPTLTADAIVLRSPDAQLELRFDVVEDIPQYTLSRSGEPVILPSRLGFSLIGRDDLLDGFTLTGSSFDSLDETWEPVWGEEAQIRNHYNELLVHLKQDSDCRGRDGIRPGRRLHRLVDQRRLRYAGVQLHPLAGVGDSAPQRRTEAV